MGHLFTFNYILVLVGGVADFGRGKIVVFVDTAVGEVGFGVLYIFFV